jgi:hypothetical protein
MNETGELAKRAGLYRADTRLSFAASFKQGQRST